MLGGGKKRYGESATDKLAPLSNAKPARYPHADNTDASSVELVEMIAAFVDDLDLGDYSRWALYNLWRATTPPPQDFPLAVCDARTLDPARRGDGQGHHRGTLGRDPPRHDRLPLQPGAPLALLPRHDARTRSSCSRPTTPTPARRGRVPHTAFTDPTCPRGRADAGERRDARARALRLRHERIHRGSTHRRRGRRARAGAHRRRGSRPDALRREPRRGRRVHERRSRAHARRRRGQRRACWRWRCGTGSRSTATSPTSRASTRHRSSAPIFLTGLPAIGNDVLPVPLRPGPRPAHAAHVGR